MSAEIINLRKARKRRERAAHAARGDENRAKSGRSKRERETASKILEIDRQRLDGHHIEEAGDATPEEDQS